MKQNNKLIWWKTDLKAKKIVNFNSIFTYYVTLIYVQPKSYLYLHLNKKTLKITTLNSFSLYIIYLNILYH